MYLSRIQAGRTTPVRPQSEKQRKSTEASNAAKIEHADHVYLSAAGLALAEAHTTRGMAPERIQHFRERIAQGFYEQPEVLAELARRLIKAEIV